MKSHFADEERLRERRENSGTKRECGTNTYLGSLTSQTKREFGGRRDFGKPPSLEK
jgi:hypothetical protein